MKRNKGIAFLLAIFLLLTSSPVFAAGEVAQEVSVNKEMIVEESTLEAKESHDSIIKDQLLELGDLQPDKLKPKKTEEPAATTEGKSTADLDRMIAASAEYFKNSDDDWAAMSLSSIGKKDYVNEKALIAKAQTAVKENKTSTDLERITISLTALGYDVTKFPMADGSIVNVIEMIANYENGMYGTGLGTLNGYVFALIAYDSGQYEVPQGAKWTRETLIDYIIKHQLKDGGWNLYNEGDADSDMTAAAIQAIAPYYNKVDGVKASVDRGLETLSRMQVNFGKYKGAFNNSGQQSKPNSNSTAWVILALQNLGMDADQFVTLDTEGKSFSALDGLLSFKTTDDLFGYTSKSRVNGKATEQAFQALISYRYKKNIYLFDKPTKSLVEEVTPVKIEISSYPKSFYKQGEKIDNSNLKVTVTFSDQTTKEIQYGDPDLEVLGLDTLTTGTKNVIIQYQGLQTIFTVHVVGETPTPQPGPTPTPNPTPEPGPTPVPDKKPKAYVSVVVPKGPTVYPNGWTMKERTAYEIIPGTDTAFSMLQKTGLDYRFNFHKVYKGVYVNTIEGLSEFHGGPYSGWMYRVNGVFPNHSSSLHPVYDGDIVEWIYTRDLGKDIGGYVDGVENDDGTGVKPATVTVRNSLGGTISPSGQVKVSKLKPVTLTFTPDPGYMIEDILLNGKSLGAGGSLTLTTENTPDKAIITAVFKKADQKKPDNKKPEVPKPGDKNKNELKPTPAPANSLYGDIGGHWAESAVEYVSHKGYFMGIGEGKFGPDLAMTRGMFVSILGRMDGVKDTPTNSQFVDVDKNAFYAAHVDWAIKHNITKGVGDNKFDPNKPVTREEMAKFLDSYIAYKNIQLPQNQDVKIQDKMNVSLWAQDSVEKMYRAGVLVGSPEGNFMPKDSSTRAQVAMVIYHMDQMK